MKLLKGKKKGFTLVELLVVMAIIGILATIGIPRFLSMTESSKIATFKANHRIMQSSIAMYVADHDGTYPTDEADIQKYLAEDRLLTGKPLNAKYEIDPDGILTSTLEELKNTEDTTDPDAEIQVSGGTMTIVATP